MRISTETGSLIARVGERRAVEILSDAGFTALDYTFATAMEEGDSPWLKDDWREHARWLRSFAQDHGVAFNQAHAPYAFHWNHTDFPDLSEEILPLTIRSIEVCGLLGIPQVVVHPVHNLPYLQNHDFVWERNLAYYRSLAPYADASGVKIALENMFQWDRRRGTIVMDMLNDPQEYVRFFDELDDTRHFTCLLDTGHSGLAGGDAADAVRVLGPRLTGLHVNDNRYRDDDHLIPYQGLIDWDGVLRALADTDYRGDFTFEALHVWDRGSADFFPVQARYLYEVGVYMVHRLEGFRKERRG